MKIAILAAGKLADKEYVRRALLDADKIICADGGAEHAKVLGIIPDVVIGDMDSISKELLEELKEKTKVIVDTDQNMTDLQLAIEHAKKFSPDEISVLCAFSGRIDHQIANILLMEGNMKILDPVNELQVVDDTIELSGVPGDIISIIALTDIIGLDYEGLKWNVTNLDVKAGWVGISNEMLETKAKVCLKKGRALIIRIQNDRTLNN